MNGVIYPVDFVGPIPNSGGSVDLGTLIGQGLEIFKGIQSAKINARFGAAQAQALEYQNAARMQDAQARAQSIMSNPLAGVPFSTWLAWATLAVAAVIGYKLITS